MNALPFALLVIVLPAVAYGGDVELKSARLIDSPLYNMTRVEKEEMQRIQAGIYDGYKAELCVDDLTRCNSDTFKPYKEEVDGQTKYFLTIQKSGWDGLPAAVRDEALRERVYYTWGHANRTYSPLDVAISSDPLGASPLIYLSPKSAERYLRFGAPESLEGGLGGDAYGPNCWYNAISAIADIRSAYARSQILASLSWNRPRFMGPTEFRHHMRNFISVLEPQFGDIIRYYTDDPIYDESRRVYGGEVHAAVFVGKETYSNGAGQQVTREIALTKNGRSDLDFLIFQDVRGLDETYLPASGSDTSNSPTQIKKEYFRVKRGAALLDPASSGRLSSAHGGYLVDLKNYTDRWLCLANLIDPQADKSCYDSYPAEWKTLPERAPLAAGLAPSTAGLKLKVQRAPQFKLDFAPLRGFFKTKGSG
jgi:hypothetical protein